MSPPCHKPSLLSVSFSDASVKATAAAAYLRVTHGDGHSEVGCIMGKAKLAPVPELTTPRLELCATVLVVEMSELLTEGLDTKMDKTTFYTDSKVVLGYTSNQQRRFHVHVNNRVQRIKQPSLPDEWRYVSTEHNPDDHGSRRVIVKALPSKDAIVRKVEVEISRKTKKTFLRQISECIFLLSPGD